MTGLVNLPASLRSHLAAFVHPGVGLHTTEAAQHAVFIATRVSMSMLVIASVPLFLVVHGAPSAWQSCALFWMILPLLSVVILSRTGRLVPAQIICVISLFGLALTFAVGGGMGVALSWLLLVPIEAALTLNAIAIVSASAMTVLTACGLYLAQSWGMLSDVDFSTPVERIALLLPGVIYGATLAQLAVNTHKLHRKAELIGAARLQSLSEAIGDLVLRHDRSGNVLFAGDECQELFALAPRQLMARGFFEHVHVADRPAFLKTIADAGHQNRTMTATLRLRMGADHGGSATDGEPVFAWIEMRARQISFHHSVTGKNSESAVIIAVVRDITQAKRHEQEIEAARLKAEHASVWKDRFLANVSHELRTPLNAIIGFSEILGSEDMAPRETFKQREYAGIIHESGQHLLSVVNTILDMSKIEAGSFELTPEPFELTPLIGQCSDIISLRAKQGGVELVRDCPDDLEEIVADKRACKQILINLLSNAVKFTENGGRVIVGVRPDGNFLRIYVTDTGIGINSRDLPLLGDPFFQAKSSYDRPYEGTGLGLSVVRGLVGLHGGDICIESAPGAGTRVTVRLPLDCRHAKCQPGGSAKIETIPRAIAAPTGLVTLNMTGIKKSA